MKADSAPVDGPVRQALVIDVTAKGIGGEGG
jgi:hypothetical protein